MICNHLCDFYLGLPGTGAQMGGKDDIRMLEYGKIRVRRFLGKNIECRTRHMPAQDGLVKIVDVNNFPPGTVDDSNARFHHIDGRLVDHSHRFLETRHMEGNKIRTLKKFFQGNKFNLKTLGRFTADIWIGSDDDHFKALCTIRHHPADMAETDDAQCFSGYFNT